MRYTPNRQPTWVTPAWALEPPLNGEPSVPDMASGGVATKVEPSFVGEHADPFPAVFAPKPRIGDWIQTFTGRQAYPMDLRPSEVHIEDVAHSLAMQCRYTGHCLRFYSVAEHSVLMARWVLAEGMDSSVALAALLHDATEAYLTDIPRPVKPFLRGYKEAEATAWAIIAERFGLFNVPPAVHEADARILVDERSQNMAPSAVEWVMPHPDPLGVTLQFWTPEQAKAEFLACYWSLIETGRH